MQRQLYVENSEVAQKLIQDYINNTNACYTSRDIHQYFKKMTSMNISKYSIVKFLKKTLNKSHKRWSSRPAKYDPLRITARKKLFSIELANMLE